MYAVRPPVAKVELTIVCHNLKKLDKMSKSDPFVIVNLKDHQDASPWVEIGKTETVMYFDDFTFIDSFRNDQNPKFKTKIQVDFYFERVQLLRFEVWDYDQHKHDFIGDFDCKLGEIVGARGQVKTGNLINTAKGHDKTFGSITIFADEIYNPPQFAPFTNVPVQVTPGADFDTEIAQLQAALAAIPPSQQKVTYFFKSSVSAKHLDKKDLFGKSDPYFKIYRVREQETIPVFESAVIMKTLDPNWVDLNITMHTLCNDNVHYPLRMEVFDWDKNSAHDLIGSFDFTVDQVMTGKHDFPLLHHEKKQKKGYENSGVFCFTNPSVYPVTETVDNPQYVEINGRIQSLIAKKQQRIKALELEEKEKYKRNYQVIENPHSFVQYIAGGCEISLMVAIDFTGSNGDPQYSNSLHYISSKPNEYQQAIKTVGSILQDFDYDKIFQTYGFGGSYGGSTNHAFPLNGGDANCYGVDGILETYSKAIKKYGLSGPTYFHKIIETAKCAAKEFISQEKQKYFILLIITDGVIEMIDETIHEIIEASEYPLSIVIVGVGNADFGSMDRLDSDKAPLLMKRHGKEIWAKRDITQFVPFSKYKHDPQLLAQETLAEIPRQLVYFMGQKGFTPNPKIKVEPQVPIPPGM